MKATDGINVDYEDSAGDRPESGRESAPAQGSALLAEEPHDADEDEVVPDACCGYSELGKGGGLGQGGEGDVECGEGHPEVDACREERNVVAGK